MKDVLSDELGLRPVCGTENSQRAADLIFIHGLGGGSRTTWAADGIPANFWPRWICPDFSQLGVWTLGYSTTVSAWIDRSMPLADLGNQILEELHVEGIGRRPALFITHSMGGLVLKQILSHARSQGVQRWKKIADQTRGIAFLATPHSGAKLANFAEFASVVLNTNEQVSELAQHSSRLRELHGTFLNYVSEQKPICRTYAERREVKPGVKILGLNVSIPKGILVVDETSAEPNIPGERVIPLDEDHISICKPRSRESHIYRYIASFLTDCLDLISQYPPESKDVRDDPHKPNPRKRIDQAPSQLHATELTFYTGSRKTAQGRSYNHAIAALLIENTGNETVCACDVVCRLDTKADQRPLRFRSPWMNALDYTFSANVDLRPGEIAYLPVFGVEYPFEPGAEAFFLLLSDDGTPSGSVTIGEHVHHCTGSLTVLSKSLHESAHWPFSVNIDRSSGEARVEVGERSVVLPPREAK